jgi:hypothetical protein
VLQNVRVANASIATGMGLPSIFRGVSPGWYNCSSSSFWTMVLTLLVPSVLSPPRFPLVCSPLAFSPSISSSSGLALCAPDRFVIASVVVEVRVFTFLYVVSFVMFTAVVMVVYISGVVVAVAVFTVELM